MRRTGRAACAAENTVDQFLPCTIAFIASTAFIDIPRARFTVDEVVKLTLDFYRRNYIEGLFLRSGIIRTPGLHDGASCEVARMLREVHDFRGYIHLKTIPDADETLDRRRRQLRRPTTSTSSCRPKQCVSSLPREVDATDPAFDGPDARASRRSEAEAARAPFAPAGQSTQMIVGADAADDRAILETAQPIRSYGLRRVYYSAFSPIPGARRTAVKPPPLVREHRLYQADWLMRHYDFSAKEITAADGMLDLDIDPKLAWALVHAHRFPVDLNRAPREMLLRVPGLGTRSVDRVIAARRVRAVCCDDLQRLHLPLRKILPFITMPGHRSRADIDTAALEASVRPSPQQLALFDSAS